jgi:hypothetical protein
MGRSVIVASRGSVRRAHLALVLTAPRGGSKRPAGVSGLAHAPAGAVRVRDPLRAVARLTPAPLNGFRAAPSLLAGPPTVLGCVSPTGSATVIHQRLFRTGFGARLLAGDASGTCGAGVTDVREPRWARVRPDDDALAPCASPGAALGTTHPARPTGSPCPPLRLSPAPPHRAAHAGPRTASLSRSLLSMAAWMRCVHLGEGGRGHRGGLSARRVPIHVTPPPAAANQCPPNESACACLLTVSIHVPPRSSLLPGKPAQHPSLPCPPARTREAPERAQAGPPLPVRPHAKRASIDASLRLHAQRPSIDAQRHRPAQHPSLPCPPARTREAREPAQAGPRLPVCPHAKRASIDAPLRRHAMRASIGSSLATRLAAPDRCIKTPVLLARALPGACIPAGSPHPARALPGACIPAGLRLTPHAPCRARASQPARLTPHAPSRARASQPACASPRTRPPGRVHPTFTGTATPSLTNSRTHRCASHPTPQPTCVALSASGSDPQ